MMRNIKEQSLKQMQNTKTNHQPENTFDMKAFTSLFHLAKFHGKLVSVVICAEQISDLHGYDQSIK